MILDLKVVPPPPYMLSSHLPPFPSSSLRVINLTQLPPHLLLQIIYRTFPQTDLPDEDKIQRQRKTLYWLSISLRLVNRTFYVASMHVLRSSHISAYNLLIRHPYSSDPFPLLPNAPSPSSSSIPTSMSPLSTIQRETATLDRFIALKVREDVWADDTELHLERDEAYKDLFDLAQPKSRLEDLIRDYGIPDGVVCIDAPPSTPAPAHSSAAPSSSTSKSLGKSRVMPGTPPFSSPRTTPHPPQPPISLATTTAPTSFFSSLFSRSSSIQTPTTPITPLPPPREQQLGQTRRRIAVTPIPFHLLSVSFSIRQVGLVLNQPSTKSKRTIVTVQRATRDEKLEVAAKKLVRELRAWLEAP